MTEQHLAWDLVGMYRQSQAVLKGILWNAEAYLPVAWPSERGDHVVGESHVERREERVVDLLEMRSGPKIEMSRMN